MIETGDSSGTESTGELEKIASTVDQQRTEAQLAASVAGERPVEVDQGDTDADSVMVMPPSPTSGSVGVEQPSLSAPTPERNGVTEKPQVPLTHQEPTPAVKPAVQLKLETSEATEEKSTKTEKVVTALVVTTPEVIAKDEDREQVPPSQEQPVVERPVEEPEKEPSQPPKPQVGAGDGGSGTSPSETAQNDAFDDDSKRESEDTAQTEKHTEEEVVEDLKDLDKSSSREKLRNASRENVSTPGNIWAPETPPYGFEVQTLSKASTPISTYLAFADTAEVVKSVTGQVYKKDKVRMVGPQDRLKPAEVLLEVDAHVTVSRADLDKLHRKGREVRPGRFPKEEREAFAKGLQYAVRKEFAPGWESLPRALIDRQKKLNQVVAFESGGKSVDLYNFSQTRIDKEQIGRVANAIREMSDRTGGALFEMLDALAIVSTDDPSIAEKNGEGECTSTSAGITYGGAVVLSERLFNPGTLLPVVTAPVLANLYAEIDDDNPFVVAGDKLQLTVLHELTHVVELRGNAYDLQAKVLYGATVGWDREQEESGHLLQRGYVENPVVYGRLNEVEDLAVTAEAQFAGGEQWAKYDVSRRLGLQAIWAQRRSGIFGPTFVTAKEMPLPRWPDKIGLPRKVPLAIKPTYIYTPQDSANLR
jgi:hypothetical protein